MRNATKRWLGGLLAVMVAATAPAAETANTLFWSISGPGGHAGYLLGTIHSEDPRVLDFPPAIVDTLEASELFAMELVPDLPTLKALDRAMHFQDGTTLDQLIGRERFDRLSRLLAEYRLPAARLADMRPWAAMITLSVPPPETGLFMDFSLSLRAAGSGLKVVSLESLDEQLAFLRDMPLERQLELLDQAMDDVERSESVYLEMLDHYLAGDLAALSAQAEAEMAPLTPATRSWFMEQGIDARNARMVTALEGHLAEGTVFATAGALHLPGEDGLVNLLREAGWTLEPLPNPFGAAGG